MGESTEVRRAAGRLLAVGLVVLSPLLAESLSGYDDTTGDPAALLAGLLILVPLYGCAALLIREMARRWNVGWPGIVALSIAFGVLQAGVIDQSMFSMSYRDVPYWDDMLLPTLIEPLGFAPYLAMSFVAGHVVWSFGVPIALIESLGSTRAHTPWLRWPGIVIAAVLFAAAGMLILLDHLHNEDDHASAAQVGTALTVVAALITGTWMLSRRPAVARRDAALPRPYIVGLLSLAVAAGFNLLPPTWLGFAAGMALLAASAWVLLRVSPSTRWDDRYIVAAAGGAMVAMACAAFFVTPLGDVPPVRKYAHNIVFLLGGLALIAWAAVRAGRSRTSTAEQPDHDPRRRGRAAAGSG